MRHDWSPHDVARLRQFWINDSLPTGAIAARFGVTRQAIASARHRFDLPARGKAPGRPAVLQDDQPAAPPPVAAEAVPPPPAPMPPPKAPAPPLRPRQPAREPIDEMPLADAPRCGCIWPLWQDGARPRNRARFCDAPPMKGRSYCRAHQRAAYRRPGEPWDRNAEPAPLARAA
jgi:hypothetical protein